MSASWCWVFRVLAYTQGSHMYCSGRSSHTISPFPYYGLLGVQTRSAMCHFNSKVKSSYFHFVHMTGYTTLQSLPARLCRTEFSAKLTAAFSGGPISAIYYTFVLDNHSGERYGSGRSLHLAYAVTSPNGQFTPMPQFHMHTNNIVHNCS
jgi:hypothetical protein